MIFIWDIRQHISRFVWQSVRPCLATKMDMEVAAAKVLGAKLAAGKRTLTDVDAVEAMKIFAALQVLNKRLDELVSGKGELFDHVCNLAFEKVLARKDELIAAATAGMVPSTVLPVPRPDKKAEEEE